MKEEQIKLTISNLPHTWFIDLDGTIFKHNHYKKYEKDIFCNSNVKSEESSFIIYLVMII